MKEENMKGESMSNPVSDQEMDLAATAERLVDVATELLLVAKQLRAARNPAGKPPDSGQGQGSSAPDPSKDVEDQVNLDQVEVVGPPP